MKTYYILSSGVAIEEYISKAGETKEDVLTNWINKNDFEYDVIDEYENGDFYAIVYKDGLRGEIAISESKSGTYTTWVAEE